MIANYSKTALRNMRRTRVFTFVNIMGLAVGMAACLLILNYVRFERSFDRFYKDSDRIYRLRYERTSEEGTSVRFASCCPPAAEFIRDAYPEVEKIARIYHARGVVAIRNRDVKFTEERMYYAEPDFFDIFNIPFLAGDPVDGILEPNRAFLSISTARKYFGNEDPMGQTFTVDGKFDFTVAGIFADIPRNSHLKFDILLSFRNIISLRGPEVMGSWGYTGFFTYLRLKPGADPDSFEKKLVSLVEDRCSEMMRTYKVLVELKMQPLQDIHLTSHFLQEYEVNGHRGTVDFLTIVAVFIIIMAWVNYVNLSTARALTRAREVGLRKVVGASRRNLIAQFFFEISLVNFIAVVLALLLLKAALPSFLQLTGAADAGLWSAPWFWTVVVIMYVAGILLSGLYPVAAMSAFQPSAVLRGRLGNTPKGVNLRKVLLVFQFVIALGLVSGAFTVYRQLDYLKSRDLGFDLERIMVVKAPRIKDEAFREKYRVFKEELLKNPNIMKMCVATEVPGRQLYWDAGAIFRAGQDSGRGKNYMIVGIDDDFLDVFGLKLVQGRNFSEEFPGDMDTLILNQTAVNWMGFESDDEAVGKRVDYWGKIYTIIGVLADYHQQSPKAAFEPQIYRLMPFAHPEIGCFAAKIGSRRIEDTVHAVAVTYDRLFPGNPFEYFFLEEYFNQQYLADERFGQVVGLFSLLAVFVTGLGIFGMSSFVSLQRMREIGIRKVLGASMVSLLRLLSQDFLVLIGLATLLAWPLTFWGIRQWLNSFAYRTGISGLLFLGPLVLLTAITGLTISFHIIRAALADPVEVIKHE